MSEAVNSALLSEFAETPVASAPATMSVGERLALARTQQNLTVEQVADQLKWSARQISEIEAGNYAVLPDLSTVRGFVRTYAKILKVDSIPLMNELPKEFARLPVKIIERQALDTPYPTGRMPWLGRQNNRSQWILAGLFLAFLCLLALFVYRGEVAHVFGNILPATPVEQVIKADDNTPALNPVIAASESASLVTESVLLVENSPKANEVSALPPAPEAPVRTEIIAQPNVRAEIALPQPVKAAVEKTLPLKLEAVNPEAALQLSFKQDSWLQIRQTDGKPVISQLFRAGSKYNQEVKSSLDIIIGNAPGVEVKLRGQPVELKAQAGSNVVNLSVK